MKNVFFTLLLSIGVFNMVNAQDDIYDKPAPAPEIIYNGNQNQNNMDDNDNYQDRSSMPYSNRLRRMYDPYFSYSPMMNYGYANPYMSPYSMYGGSGFSISIGSYSPFYNPYNSFYDPFNSFYNPYSSFYSPYGYNPYCGNMFYNSFYSPYYNPYSSFYSPYNYGYSSHYNNSYYNKPSVTLPRRQTPRGFGRYDETYRPSPARRVNTSTSQPSTNNGNYRNSREYQNNVPAPNNNGGFSNPSYGGRSTEPNNNSGTFSSPSTPRSSGSENRGGNGGRTGRF